MRALLALCLALATQSASVLNGFVLTTYSPGVYSSNVSAQALREMAQTNVRVVQVMFTWYVPNSVNSTSIAPTGSSPTDADVLAAIASARAAGMQVALKPHIDCLDSVWRAHIGTGFTTEAQWGAFFASYTAFVLHSAALARQGGAVGGFNVGTELDGTFHREAEWRAVIAAVRGALPAGVPLWLGPNHSWNGTQGYRLVHFWDALDFLGVDMYAPLASHPDPTLQEAVAGWAPIIGNLSQFYTEQGAAKGFILAEIGYASYQGAAQDPPGCCVGPPDAPTQAILYASFFQAVYTQPWLAGVFWWAWDASHTAATTAPCSTDFDVVGKAAQGVVAQAYGGGAVSRSGGALGASAPSAASAPPLSLYANGHTQLSDWSFGAAVALASAANPYPGHSASCSVSVSAEYGALALRAQAPVNATPYSSLQFDLRVDPGNVGAAYTLQAWLCACDDCGRGGQCPALPALDVDAYAPPPSAPCTIPFAWGAARVSIPLADLLPGRNATAFKRLQLGGDKGLQFSVDNVCLV
jgi:hypothetical protein